MLAKLLKHTSKRFTSCKNGVLVKEPSLTTLRDIPLEHLVCTAIESVNILELLNEKDPKFVKATALLNKEEYTQNIKKFKDKETEHYFSEVNDRIKKLRNEKKELPYGLNEEDLASILLYTEENESEFFVPIYKAVNKTLAERSRPKTKRAGSYILNLLSVLRKLPLYEGDVLYRGVSRLSELSLTEGLELSWPAFTSTTYDLEVAKSFASNKENGGYIYEIKGRTLGYDISGISSYNEKGNYNFWHYSYYINFRNPP